MIPHAIILCSRRRAFPLRLLDRARLDHVTIMVEAGHPHRFPSGGRENGPTVDVVEIEDIRDASEVLRSVWRVSAVRPVHRVISPVEFGVATAGFLRSALGIPGESFDVGLAFSDKFLMKQRLAEAGMRTAGFARVFEPAQVAAAGDRFGWPLVVKPEFGGACMDVARLDGPAAAVRWATGPVAARIRESEMPLVVEQYIRMDREFHVDAVIHDGAAAFVAVSAYFDPLLGRAGDFSGSWVLPADHPDHAEASSLAVTAALALGLRDGVIHVELFRTDDGFLIGEAACRPAGGGILEALRYQYGVDLWDAFWDIGLGGTPELAPGAADGIVVNVHLPIRPGRIVALSSPEELRSTCPGLIELRMTMQVGEVISADLNSSSSTGLVFFRASDEAEVYRTLASLLSAYRLEVAPA